MKISNVYTQEETNKQYTYRFEFKDITHVIYPSFMLHCTNRRLVGSMLCHLHKYSSLYKVKAYETIRS